MAAGDAQRVWFPEMIEQLRSRWREEMAVEAVIELRDELDAMLQQIRASRHIRPPQITCPRCGHAGNGAEPHVSVRAMLCSLRRFCIVEPDRVKSIEKAWAGYRHQHRLDLNGKPVTAVTACLHPLN